MGIMEDYANKDSVMFTRVGCVVPSLLSEVGGVEECIKNVFYSLL